MLSNCPKAFLRSRKFLRFGILLGRVYIMATKSYPRKTKTEKKEQVQQLLNQLNEGVLNFDYSPEKFKAILLMQALMPSYSFKNVMLINSQLSGATYVASFKRWKELNRNVVKGQKALRILAPRIKKEEDEITGEEDSKLVGFIGVPVFDISQTEGDPLPIDSVKLKLEGDSLEAMKIFTWTKRLAVLNGCIIRIGYADGANGYYAPGSHSIMIDSKLSPNHMAKTAVHELVHSRLHRYAVNKTTEEERESVAEGVAFIVCTYLGLDTSDYSFEYVRGWSSDDGKSLLKYGEIIQKTANKMIEDYEWVSKGDEEVETPMPSIPRKVRGVDIVEATAYRIPKAQRKECYYYYEVRASDDGFTPVSISKSIWANHMATIVTSTPFESDCEFELTDEEAELLSEAI